jgi:hypothetical protein
MARETGKTVGLVVTKPRLYTCGALTALGKADFGPLKAGPTCRALDDIHLLVSDPKETAANHFQTPTSRSPQHRNPVKITLLMKIVSQLNLGPNTSGLAKNARPDVLGPKLSWDTNHVTSARDRLGSLIIALSPLSHFSNDNICKLYWYKSGIPGVRKISVPVHWGRLGGGRFWPERAFTHLLQLSRYGGGRRGFL